MNRQSIPTAYFFWAAIAAALSIHLCAVNATAGDEDCIAGWVENFSPSALGVNGFVDAMVVFDDGLGGGPALYIGGSFTQAGGVAVNRIARWDGESFSAVGTGVFGGSILSLEVYDSGVGGPALYAGGSFNFIQNGQEIHGIARWNPVTGFWEKVGGGLSQIFGQPTVTAMKVFQPDSPPGKRLYVAGSFAGADGAFVNNIASWNGTSWFPLQQGLTGSVLAMEVHDTSGAPELYIGGSFTVPNANSPNLVKWTGETWAAISGVNGAVHAIERYEDDAFSQPYLYIGGAFTMVGAGQSIPYLARYTGVSWLPALTSQPNGPVRMLQAYETSSGPRLMVGGQFTAIGGVTSARLAIKGAGQTWQTLGSGADGVPLSSAVFDDGTGAAVYIGGAFTLVSGRQMNRLTRWDGEVFTAFGEGFNGRMGSAVRFDDGSGVGPAVYAAGQFTHAGKGTALGVARFVDGEWEPVGAGFSPAPGSLVAEVRALKVFDDGGGPRLYAGGSFHSSDGAVVNNIARWNGSSWESVGGGVTFGSAGVGVYDMEVFDDGSGPALYVNGIFTSAGGVANTGYIARWNGMNWSSVGGGSTQPQWVLHVHDDGSQKVLVTGGIGIQGLTNVAKWNGVSWTGFGAGLSSGGVHALATWNDGTGVKLYAGGQFQSSGAQSVTRLAQWNGSSWQPMGGGLNDTVFDMVPFDDGSGEMLYIGGRFNTETITLPSNRIVAWNGTDFASVDEGMGGDGPDFAVYDLAVINDGLGGGGPSLYVLGGFMQAGPYPSPYIAKWQGCAEGVPGGGVGDLDNNGVVNVFDLLLLLAAWGPCNNCVADLNNDDVVNVFDLLILLANWG